MRANQDSITKIARGNYLATFFTTFGSCHQRRFRSRIQAERWMYDKRIADGQDAVQPIRRGHYAGCFWLDETTLVVKSGFKTFAAAEQWMLDQRHPQICKWGVDDFVVSFLRPNAPCVCEKGFKTYAEAEAWLLAWRRADGQVFLDGWQIDAATGWRVRDAA